MSRKTVIVGVDGSKTSLDAFREAATYARLMDADLRAIVTWNFVSYEDPAGVYDPELTAKEIAAAAVDTVFGDAVPAWLTVVTKSGPAGEALVEESGQVDLLVVGTRGHSGLGGLLLGSVSTYCAEHSKCPVLVVPEKVQA